MTILAPEWVRTSDPVIRSPARYRWTTAPALDDWWGWGLLERKARSHYTHQRLHRNKTQSTGSVGKILDSQLCHYWELWTRESTGTSCLKAPSEGGGVGWGVVRLRLQPGHYFCARRPKEAVFKVFDLNWWPAFCYHDWIMVLGANCPLCPHHVCGKNPLIF